MRGGLLPTTPHNYTICINTLTFSHSADPKTHINMSLQKLIGCCSSGPFLFVCCPSMCDRKRGLRNWSNSGLVWKGASNDGILSEEIYLLEANPNRRSQIHSVSKSFSLLLSSTFVRLNLHVRYRNTWFSFAILAFHVMDWVFYY